MKINKYFDYLIVNYKKIHNFNISNQRLQYLAFIAYAEGAVRFQKELFKSAGVTPKNPTSWRVHPIIGPICVNEYYTYSDLREIKNISESYKSLTPQETMLLDEVLEKTKALATNTLKNNITKGAPWEFRFEGRNMGNIPFSEIYEYYQDIQKLNHLYERTYQLAKDREISE